MSTLWLAFQHYLYIDIATGRVHLAVSKALIMYQTSDILVVLTITMMISLLNVPPGKFFICSFLCPSG